MLSRGRDTYKTLLDDDDMNSIFKPRLRANEIIKEEDEYQAVQMKDMVKTS